MPNSLKDHGLLLEAVTRARKTVILVASDESAFSPTFSSAEQHYELKKCSLDMANACDFLGAPQLIKRDKVGIPAE